MSFESQKESEKTQLHAPDGTQRDAPAEKSPQLPTEQKLDHTALSVREAPLVLGEDAAAYQRIVDRLYDQVKPKDFLEETYADDAIDHIWEINRLRKYLKHLINAGIVLEIVKLLEPTKGKAGATELARAWWKDQAQGEVAELLTNWGLTIGDLASRSYAALLSVIDRLKGQIADAEKQRNAALDALERYRASFAVVLRRASEDILDADFTPVEASGRNEGGKLGFRTGNGHVESQTVDSSNEALPAEWQQLLGQIDGLFRAANISGPDASSKISHWRTNGYKPRIILRVIKNYIDTYKHIDSMNSLDAVIANEHAAFGVNRER
jgi:hypothetical protein